MSFAPGEAGINNHDTAEAGGFMWDSITKYIIHMEDRAVEFIFSPESGNPNSRHLLIDKKSNFCLDKDYDSLVNIFFSETNDLYFKYRKTKEVGMVVWFLGRILTSYVSDLY